MAVAVDSKSKGYRRQLVLGEVSCSAQWTLRFATLIRAIAENYKHNFTVDTYSDKRIKNYIETLIERYIFKAN